jgi:hypothetical protein
MEILAASVVLRGFGLADAVDRMLTSGHYAILNLCVLAIEWLMKVEEGLFLRDYK